MTNDRRWCGCVDFKVTKSSGQLTMYRWSSGSSARLETEIGGSSIQEEGLNETHGPLFLTSPCMEITLIEVSCSGLSADLIL